MKKIVIIYESVEGHTREVAERMGAAITAADCQVSSFPCKSADSTMLSEADGILLGGSIHAGKHNKKLMRFAETHRDLLGAKPSAFFLVCLTAKFTTPEKKAEVAAYLKDFAERTGFSPGRSVAFAGALKYTKYNFLKRALMKSISNNQGGDIDTSRDFVYTDWDAVDAFAKAFVDSPPSPDRH